VLFMRRDRQPDLVPGMWSPATSARSRRCCAGGLIEQDSAELRKVVEKAIERRRLYRKRTILFVKQVLETFNSG
jgi:hypothetical protein